MIQFGARKVYLWVFDHHVEVNRGYLESRVAFILSCNTTILSQQFISDMETDCDQLELH